MADDTLSPVGFDRAFIKANVPCEDRFALACVLADHRKEDERYTEQDMVRAALNEWLVEMGWDMSRRIQEHAAHRVRCLQAGRTNEYGKE